MLFHIILAIGVMALQGNSSNEKKIEELEKKLKDKETKEVENENRTE
jgi:hypothetical protein